MKLIQSLTRFQACGIHLLISVLLAIVSITLVFLVWYPGIYSYASNVTVIFLILLGVDITLGPFLTFVVFNIKKKELQRDLLIIFLLQVVALLYGLHTLFINRPVYVAYNSGRFDTVYANDIKEESFKEISNPKFRHLPFLGPEIIAAPLPDNGEESTKIVVGVLSGKGDDVQYLPQYYVEYETQKESVLKEVKPLSNLRSFNKEQEQQLDSLIEKYRQQGVDVGYLPVTGKGKFICFIIDKSTAQIVEKSTLKPFP